MAREIQSISAAQTELQFSNGTRLSVSPFAGAATQWTGDPGSLRAFRLPAEEDSSAEFLAALAELDIIEQETIHLDVSGPGDLRAFDAAPENDQIVLRPAPPGGGSDAVQVVLYQDESGGLSWHFSDEFFEAAKSSKGLRAAAEPVFTIPTRTVEAQTVMRSEREPSHLRGPITKIGRKIFKVLVIPILAPLLAAPLENIVGKIERKYRRDIIRQLTPGDFRQPATRPFTDWKSLDGQRSLLVIHGIFSSSDGMLAGLPVPAMTQLFQFYQGRTLAFDHLTVCQSPEDNARFFLEHLQREAPQARFEFDILCHSRGGIVSRTLAERGHLLVPGNNCKFRRVYFVATPNQGSVLADPDHIVEMLDVFTNLLTNFPDGPQLYAIEVFLAIVKLLAYTAECSLPGLAAMGRDGYIKDVLNAGTTPSPAFYASASADYQPAPGRDNGFFAGTLANSVIDRIFLGDDGPVSNDLVVPRDGVHGKNGHPSFPIQNALIYEAADRVWHTGFFAESRTIEHIKAHFEILNTSPIEKSFGAPATVDPATEEPLEIGKSEITDEETDFLLNGNSSDRFGQSFGSGVREFDNSVPSDGAPAFGNGGAQQQQKQFPNEQRQQQQQKQFPNEQRQQQQQQQFQQHQQQPSQRQSPPWSQQQQQQLQQRLQQQEQQASPPQVPPPLPTFVPLTGAEAAPIELQRDPHIDFHEQVEAGATNDLVVRLEELASDERQEFENAFSIAFNSGQQDVEISVTLSAPGFDVEGPAAAILTVGRRRNGFLEQATFRLTARPPGLEPKTRTITASFFLGNSCLGSVSHRTCVIPLGYAGPRPGDGSSQTTGFTLPLSRREDCDLIISVTGQDDSGQPPFRIGLRSEIPNNSFADRFMGLLQVPGGDLAAYLDSFYRPYISAYPSSRLLSAAEFQARQREWETDFSDALTQLGKQLWTFLPQRLRDEYFELCDVQSPPRSLGIFSDEMIFPWELVVPHQTKNGQLEVREPLGTAHILGRWKPGLITRPVPQNLPVRNICVLNPSYAAPNELAWSVKEVAALKKLFPNAIVVAPANKKTVQAQILDRSDIQLFHFSGHGDYNAANSDLNHLMLEGTDTLDPIRFVGTRFCAESRPVVYLNACSVGSAGLTVGRMGGFAASFLENGCSGVIAPYWPINDERAAKFSVSLYSKLKLGRPIGEALQQLRSENADDPTFRAFSYFGDPWARLVFA